jgi:hypothetical protein
MSKYCCHLVTEEVNISRDEFVSELILFVGSQISGAECSDDFETTEFLTNEYLLAREFQRSSTWIWFDIVILEHC